jgi:peptide/nickel transport system permease protein
MGWLRGNRRLQIGLVLLVPFLVLALLPGVFAPHGPNELIGVPFAKPSTTYWLGTDDLGRDTLSRLIYAAREDLKISLSSTAISAVLGVLIGLLAGYRGGLVDALVLRATDVMLAFPSILLALFLIAIVGQSDKVVILALALLFLPGFVRLARGLALSIRQRGFVEASALSGGGALHIVRRHLLPNALGPILVGFALTASYALLATATLSYLGLGTPLPNPSWGNMLQEAFGFMFLDWWAGIFPGACIVLVSLGYLLVAGGVEDALGRRVGFRPLGGGSAAAAPGALGESLPTLVEEA